MSKAFAEAFSEYISESDRCFGFVCDLSDGTFSIENSSGLFKSVFVEGINPIVQLQKGDAVHPADREMVSMFCGELLAPKGVSERDGSLSINFRLNTGEAKSPVYEWVIMNIIPRSDGNDNINSIIGCIHIMTVEELVNKDIVDSFTNDTHPKVYENRVRSILESGANTAFVQFDIEKFRFINTEYSEKTGNDILDHIRNGLDVICAEKQVHFRLAADIFVIVTAYNSRDEIDVLIGNINRLLSRYGSIEYKLVFGVYFADEGDKTAPVRILMDRVALARESVKGSALKNVGYYAKNQENVLNLRRQIEERMYYALEHNEFEMYLQPKYSIEANKIVGAEALARWRHPEYGLISPAVFIPVFEQNGFIIKLDEYIWEQACKAVRKWIDMVREPVTISINISRVHLDSGDFIGKLNALIKKYDIPQKYIETEITETVENSRTENAVRELKDNGYVLLMDDFGSGYSSLNTLKSTPFDVIKIDRAFFSEFMLSERGKKIIAHTIAMSKDIGLDMVAEGVETKEQASFLSQCGCDTVQGFLYSKPVPLAEFEKMAYGA